MRNFAAFKKTVNDYYRRRGRHDLPWRLTRDPYQILVSEIMLQQTQVPRVIGKYKEFLERFPTVRSLARASTAAVLKAWSGLGYNRRALHLKRAAEIIVGKHGGVLPQDARSLDELPGVGANTAGAILAYAFDEPAVFIETNIRRVFIHHFFPKKKNVDDADILPFVARTLDRRHPGRWYSALMDYGTYLAGIVENPNRRSRHYAKQSTFAGSDRQLRGRILRLLLAHGRISDRALIRETGETTARVRAAIQTLIRDDLVRRRGVAVFPA